MSRKVKGFLFHSSQLVENHACNHSEMLIYHHVWKTLSCPLNLDTTYSSSAKVPQKSVSRLPQSPAPPSPTPLAPWPPLPPLRFHQGTLLESTTLRSWHLGGVALVFSQAFGERPTKSTASVGWTSWKGLRLPGLGWVHWESLLGRKAREKSGEF